MPWDSICLWQTRLLRSCALVAESPRRDDIHVDDKDDDHADDDDDDADDDDDNDDGPFHIFLFVMQRFDSLDNSRSFGTWAGLQSTQEEVVNEKQQEEVVNEKQQAEVVNEKQQEEVKSKGRRRKRREEEERRRR